jgi:hypothetical protein
MSEGEYMERAKNYLDSLEGVENVRSVGNQSPRINVEEAESSNQATFSSFLNKTLTDAEYDAVDEACRNTPFSKPRPLLKFTDNTAQEWENHSTKSSDDADHYFAPRVDPSNEAGPSNSVATSSSQAVADTISQTGVDDNIPNSPSQAVEVNTVVKSSSETSNHGSKQASNHGSEGGTESESEEGDEDND